MNAKTKAKLAEFIRIGNELDAEAKRRYGKDAFLFHEADGGVYIMDGDSNISTEERLKHIKVSSDDNARWGAGAW